MHLLDMARQRAASPHTRHTSTASTRRERKDNKPACPNMMPISPIELSSDEEEEERTRPSHQQEALATRITFQLPGSPSNMAGVEQAKAEPGLLGLKSRAVQLSTNAQCLWEAIGMELVHIEHPLFPAEERNLGTQVQKHVAAHVNDLDEEEWRRL